MNYEGKVTRQGQITLPKKIRMRYSIKEGDRITCIDLGDHIVIVPRSTDPLKTLLSMKIKTKDTIQEIKRKINQMAMEEAGKNSA